MGPRVQVIAHSVGSWNAYEFLMLARARGLPMPKHAFLSAMAAPDIPEHSRPWRRNKDLDEDSFKVSDLCCDASDMLLLSYSCLFTAVFTANTAVKRQL